MLTGSLRHVAPSRITAQFKGGTAMASPARPKGATPTIFLLGVVALAPVLFRHDLHWQWKAAWVAIVVFTGLAALFFAAAIGRRSPLQRAAESDEVTGHLSELLADLKAGEAQSEARRGLRPTVIEDQSATQMRNEETTNAEVAAPVATPAAASDDPLTPAQRLLAEQRKAAEALLLEACALEERLKGEAKAAQAASECAAAKAKADGAAILEQQAKELAQASSERRAVLAAEREDAEKLVVATRADAEAARAQVAELEQRLLEHEARAKEWAAKQAAAEHDAAEALARVVACQTERVAAEKEANAAEERAEALKNELAATTQSLAGIDDVQALAARIAEQASVLKHGPLTSAEWALLAPEPPSLESAALARNIIS
jgi:hypothetical protein